MRSSSAHALCVSEILFATGTAAALEAMHIPAGTERVIFKTLNTKRCGGRARWLPQPATRRSAPDSLTVGRWRASPPTPLTLCVAGV